MMTDYKQSQISTSTVVLIPCYNEENTVAQVINDFRQALPDADIIVFDNNSTDQTAKKAEEAGAKVFYEPRQGKGNVVRTMFRNIDAQTYILVDGDSTYQAKDVENLIAPVLSGQAEMVVGNRMAADLYNKENKRRFHSFGNQLVRSLVNKLFKTDLHDIMSGYRAFSRLFVQSVPILSPGFEIETEITLHALDKHLRIVEVPIEYRDRPQESHSKLNTFADGFKVLKTIAFVFKNYKPLVFFSWASLFMALLGMVIGFPPILEFIRFQYVFKVPSAVLAAAIEILAMLLFCCGLILETVVTLHREQFEVHLKTIKRQSRE